MDEAKTQSRLLDLAEALISAAKQAGADSADAVALQSAAVSSSVRLGKIEESESSEANDMGLRVFIGRRQAIVSSNMAERADLKELAERAVAMARVAPEDPYAGLADPELLAKDWDSLDSLDSYRPSADELAGLALAAESAGLAEKGISNSNGAGASFSLGGMVLATSGGFSGGYLVSGFSLSCSLVAGEGTGMERDYDYATATHFADLDAPEEIGRRSAERTLRRLNPRKAQSSKVPVVYDPRVASGLVGHFLNAISGAAIARKTSFLKEHLEKPVFAPGITIVDDPLRRRGRRSRPFDAEGVATRTMKLAEDGVLKTWLLDSASGRELGLASTGHARRGVSGPPSPGASNVHMEAGATTPEAMISGISSGLYVTDLIGQGVNGVTGDYSRGAAGLWIENGELSYPVSEVTIAGNLKDMYASLVPASDLEFRHAVNAPTVLIPEMMLAGR